MRRVMLSRNGHNREIAYKENKLSQQMVPSGSRKEGLERIVADFQSDKITRADMIEQVRTYFYTKYNK